ncbi:MAG TPA: MarR family winged helix-turn-helix transcriptional regulator [Polyangiaceae bacterium]
MNEPAIASDFSLGPSGDFMRKLWELNHELERASRCTEALFGVTGQQRLMIRCVGKYPGMTPSQLAGHFHLDPGTVSIAVDRLEEKGLLERRRSPQDRRRVTLGLTALGRKVDGEVTGISELAVQKLLGSTGGEEIESTRRVLSALVTLLGSEVERGRERLEARQRAVEAP